MSYWIPVEEMEEPVRCDLCNTWHELKDLQKCDECDRMVCEECFRNTNVGDGACKDCKEQNHE